MIGCSCKIEAVNLKCIGVPWISSCCNMLKRSFGNEFQQYVELTRGIGVKTWTFLKIKTRILDKLFYSRNRFFLTISFQVRIVRINRLLE